MRNRCDKQFVPPHNSQVGNYKIKPICTNTLETHKTISFTARTKISEKRNEELIIDCNFHNSRDTSRRPETNRNKFHSHIYSETCSSTCRPLLRRQHICYTSTNVRGVFNTKPITQLHLLPSPYLS